MSIHESFPRIILESFPRIILDFVAKISSQPEFFRDMFPVNSMLQINLKDELMSPTSPILHNFLYMQLYYYSFHI